MENQKNNYVVSNYRDRLLHNIEDYGLKKLYEELRIYRGEDVSSTVPEADEKKRWRNFKNSIDFIKDGNGLLNNAEDLVFVLDRIGLDFHELLTNKEGKYKERVDEQNRRIESILLGINNKLPEEKKVSKRQKRKVNTKSLNSAVDIYKNIFYIVTNYIEKYLCSESEISNWMYAPYNDFKRLYLYLFKNESLRRKLKKDEYQFVLDSIALFETKNESLITWYSFDSPKHFEIYSSNTISNLSPTLTDFESINIMIVLISFYIMAIHNFYSTIKNHKGFDDEIIQSNIDSINILINKQKILIKKFKDVIKLMVTKLLKVELEF